MARQYGGELYDFGEMTDDEIRAVIIQHFKEYANVDAEDIDVSVKDGFVMLTGQVGTDGEYQVAESIIHDVLGIENYSNELGVDEMERELLPEGADEAIVKEAEADDQIGDGPQQQSDTAEHLVDDLESATFGTHDPGTAIRDATPYIPPDSPTPDGYDSKENH